MKNRVRMTILSGLKILVKKLENDDTGPSKCITGPQNDSSGPLIGLKKAETKKLKPITITDFTAINFVRKHKGLDPIMQKCGFSPKNDEFEVKRSRDEKFMREFAKHINENTVENIYKSTISDIINDLNATEKVVRNARKEFIELGVLANIPNKKILSVDSDKLQEWRVENGF